MKHSIYYVGNMNRVNTYTGMHTVSAWSLSGLPNTIFSLRWWILTDLKYGGVEIIKIFPHFLFVTCQFKNLFFLFLELAVDKTYNLILIFLVLKCFLYKKACWKAAMIFLCVVFYDMFVDQQIIHIVVRMKSIFLQLLLDTT